jgi:CheY-like chemotaxis protein
VVEGRRGFDDLRRRVPKSTPPDVVLLDIAMPALDGRQIARQLRLNLAGRTA